MPIITKQLAEAIAQKLEAKIRVRKKKAHDMADVYHEGRFVTTFGIRRGSRRNLGHDHVPNQIHLGPHDTRLLGQRPISRDEWVNRMTEKGLI